MLAPDTYTLREIHQSETLISPFDADWERSRRCPCGALAFLCYHDDLGYMFYECSAGHSDVPWAFTWPWYGFPSLH